MTQLEEPPLERLVRLEEPEFYTENASSIYHRLQAEAPVFYYEPLDVFVITKHADVRYVLRHSEIFSSAQENLLSELMVSSSPHSQLVHEFFDPKGEPIFRADPPRHRELRRLLSPAFSPRGLEHMRPDIELMCDDLVHNIESGKPMDFIDEVAAVLPVKIAALLLGLGLEPVDYDRARVWSDALETLGAAQLTRDQVEMAGARFRTMNDYFRSEFDRRRSSPPSNDLISILLSAELDGGALSEAHLLTYCTTILGSTDTTRSLLAGMALALATHPAQWTMLQADRGLMPNAVDEALRWTTPGRGFVRTALLDTFIRDTKIRAGQRVYLLYSAANVDQEMFARPDEFDIRRPQDPLHVTFGFGTHVCIAAMLVRMEVGALFNRLLDRFDSLQLAGDPVPIVHILRNGWHQLPLQFAGE